MWRHLREPAQALRVEGHPLRAAAALDQVADLLDGEMLVHVLGRRGRLPDVAPTGDHEDALALLRAFAERRVRAWSAQSAQRRAGDLIY